MKFNLPPELRELPLNTLRSHLYPVHPEAAARGFVSYFDGEPAYEMPGRMASSSAQGQSALSVIEALEAEHVRRKMLGAAVGTSAAGVQQPIFAAVEAGSMNHLPQISDNVDPNIDRIPVARGRLAADHEQLQQPELDALSDQINAVHQASGQVASQRRADALASVQNQINALTRLVGG